MALFTANVNNNILVAIEYVRILTERRYATESIMQELSRQNFGRVSESAKDILDRTKKGSSMDDSLDAELRKISHRNLQSFYQIIHEGDVIRRMSDLSERIMKERALAVDTLIESMTVNLKRIMILMTVPLFIFFIAMLEDALALGVETQFTVPQGINLVIIIADLALLAVVLALLGYKE